MASVRLITPKNRPPYYSLTASVAVQGKPARRYGRFDFDPTVLKTHQARLAAARAAAVAFERAEQEKINAEEKGYGKSFRTVAEECIEARRSELVPSVRLDGDYGGYTNKANTTRTKRNMLHRMCQIGGLCDIPIGKVTRKDCEAFLQTLARTGIRGPGGGSAILKPEAKSLKTTSCSKIAARCTLNTSTVEAAFKGKRISLNSACQIAMALGQAVGDMFEISADQRPLKRKTIREYANFIRLVMAYAEERYGVRNEVETLKIPDGRPGRVDCLHDNEVLALQAVLPTCTMLEQAVVLSLLNTGVRRGELAGLTWQDIDFAKGLIHIDKALLLLPDYGYQLTTTKEDNVRDIAVAPEYMDFLRRYFDDWVARRLRMGTSWQQSLEGKRGTYADSLQKLAGIDFVICNDHGFPLSPDSYGELVRRVGEKAGIPHLHPHKFRHTFVSILLSNPEIGVANVAAVAGHAQPSTTLAIYTQVYQRRLDVIRRQMSEALYQQAQAAEPLPSD